MEEILLEKPGKKIILLGNEAICRGALEAGVDFISTYPGTPASEIGNVFYRIQKEIKKSNPNFHFEFSTNEKVAMEVAAGASFSGLRSLVAMKHFGLNVASDFLLTLAYSGVRGGMVIFVADDPSCWSSAQSEQNTRFYSQMAHIPFLEPSTPQECKDFVKFAFELSEKFKIPVMIRTTTRASHQSSPVVLGKIRNSQSVIRKFIKDPHQFSTMPPRVLEMKRELFEKIEKIKKISENSPLNKVYKLNAKSYKLKAGIITSGASFLYVMEALKELNLNLPILKLGFIYPLPEKLIKNFIKKLKKVLVVEELEPYLEREIKILAKDANSKLKIYGKEGQPIEGGRIWLGRKAILPQIGELKPEYVLLAISRFSGKKIKFNLKKHLGEFEKLKIPPRSPIFCPGCPYWFIFSAIKKVVDLKNIIFGGEIGCYMMANHPVVNLQDYLYCMGSANGVAHGISKSTKQKVITFIGDSSFFHAGIPALINTVFNKSNPLIIIFDNQTTAMTGHQPHPGVGKKPEEDGVEGLKIEEIVKACGVKNLKVIDQVAQQEEFQRTLKEFLEKNEVSVIVARHPCIFVKR
jgi:indolepyruvate ferredoxin oxidoreductase alpha subunit